MLINSTIKDIEIIMNRLRIILWFDRVQIDINAFIFYNMRPCIYR